jgi:hypothetical protein
VGRDGRLPLDRATEAAVYGVISCALLQYAGPAERPRYLLTSKKNMHQIATKHHARGRRFRLQRLPFVQQHAE